MRFDRESIVETALEVGFSHAGLADVSTLHPRQEVRDMCAVDKCNAYDKTWTCPPGCGTIEECGERMQQYAWGVLLQTTAELEDSLDYEAMMEGGERQNELCKKFLAEAKAQCEDVLMLGPASCDICKTCSYPDAPCRFPDQAFAAMEGYGLVVGDVCKANDLPYYYGPNTVTYTALFLFKNRAD